jgi:RimJ/RimL family protein N-acetyltransferase
MTGGLGNSYRALTRTHAYDARVRENSFGQPVGPSVEGWQPRPFPDVAALRGQWCRVEALRADHLDGLYAELCGPEHEQLWTYSPHGPFTDPGDFAQLLDRRLEDSESVALVVVDGEGVACGIANYMAIDQASGSVEIGGIVLGPRLQRTTAATEAMYLLARHVFELGYRRYEWKCDSLNEPSRRAAARLGFTYEGRFRNHVVYKGRSRDSDWFSITDTEWPALAPAFEEWLDPANFVDGVQQSPLRF